MLGSEPLQMGGRAPSRKSTRKNIHQKINQTFGIYWVYSRFTWLFEGGSLNTAVGAGPGTIPSGPSYHDVLGFFGIIKGLQVKLD